MATLVEIKDRYSSGQVDREEFYKEMRGRHSVLREYHALLSNSEVAGIEINKDELVVSTRAGVKLQWNPDGARLAPDDLVCTGDYEPDDSLFLLDAAKGTKVAFDIGANIGYYSLNWLMRQASGGVVHAFEPVPYAYSILKRNIELNNVQNRLIANNLALSDKKGALSMFIPNMLGSGAASFKNLHPEEGSTEISVRCETLDSYFAESGLINLDLIKADVEGAELFVMRGGLQTISKHKPIIFLELLRKWSAPFGYHPNDVIKLLGDIGYRCYAGESNKLISFSHMTNETIQRNFIFAMADKHADYLARHMD